MPSPNNPGDTLPPDLEADTPTELEEDVPGCFAELGNGGVPGLNKKVPLRLASRRPRQAPKKRKRKWSGF